MIRGNLTKVIDNDSDMLFTSDRHRLSKRNVLAADALYKSTGLKGNKIMIRIINPIREHNTLFKGTKLGRIQILPDFSSVNMLDNSQEKDSTVVVKEILDLHANEISESQMSQLEKILYRFKSIFSCSSTDVGCIKNVKHEIETGNQKPIAVNPRRIPLHVEEKVDDLVQDLERKDIIVKTSSSWNFPIVVVPKKNGDIRMCVDYRRLNAVTERPIYYIPDSKQLFDCLEGAKYFSSLDLSMGYHQIEMSPNDVSKTAFTTRTGQYAFKRMPFGLCGAPQSFQRVMAAILREQNWKHCIIYLDDILIFGKTLEEHNGRLCSVLQCLAEAGVKLSPGKCSFMKRQTVYLGHVVDGNGLRTDPRKIDIIRKWPVPQITKELHTFVSLAGYYRKFIDGFSKIVRPLEVLLRDSKGKLTNWKEIHTEAFNTLKQRLSEAPVLAFPRKQGMYILDTDASHETVGAVLSQMHNGEEKVIAYASHALSKHELQYCVTRKELLAVYKYVKHFQHYLIGQKFLIRTDHRALTWMLNWRKPNTSQYCSWIAELENYDFDIEFRKGEQHINADALSRYPQCHQCDLRHDDPKLKRNIKLLDDTCYNTCMTHDFEDPVDAFIFYLKANYNLENLEKAKLPGCKETAYLWKYRENLRLVNGDTLAMIRDHNVLSVPRSCKRKGIIKEFHSKFGHLGIQGVKSIIKDYFVWQGMDFDIACVVAECTLCQRYKHKQKLKANVPGSLQASFPFDKVAIDIAGPLKVTRSGYKYILGLIDHFSKFPVLIPMKSVDSESIAEAIFTRWISLFGAPNSLHSDRGSNLNSDLLIRLCNELGIRKTKTTPYYPQGDGIVERLFRTVKPMLAIVSEERGFEWSQAIPVIEMGLRNKRSSTTGFSPSEIIFGRNIYCYEFMSNQGWNPKNSSMVDYVDHLIKNNREVQKKLRNDMRKGLHVCKNKCNEFQDGDLVWVRRIGSRSGNVLFDGPFRIMKTIGKNAFRLQNNEGKIIDRNMIYLKKYVKESNSKDSDSVKEDTSIQSASVVRSSHNGRTDAHAQGVSDRPTNGQNRYPSRTRSAPIRYGFNGPINY
jgi:hypothetical protein